VSVKWTSKVFKPAYASCHSRRQARLFYSLFDSQSYRDTAKTGNGPGLAGAGRPLAGPSRSDRTWKKV